MFLFPSLVNRWTNTSAAPKDLEFEGKQKSLSQFYYVVVLLLCCLFLFSLSVSTWKRREAKAGPFFSSSFLFSNKPPSWIIVFLLDFRRHVVCFVERGGRHVFFSPPICGLLLPHYFTGWVPGDKSHLSGERIHLLTALLFVFVFSVFVFSPAFSLHCSSRAA